MTYHPNFTVDPSRLRLHLGLHLLLRPALHAAAAKPGRSGRSTCGCGGIGLGLGDLEHEKSWELGLGRLGD
jgi:hypothetical protein